MADGKNSFVLYTDLIHTFEELTDEEAGKLIKHMLRYVNDKDPTPPDRLTKITFEPIKQQLKRSLKSWEASVEKKSTGGSLGNLKRWAPELYELVMAGKMTLQEAVAKHRIVSHTDKIDRIPSHSIASVAVSVPVSVSDSVPVSVPKEDNTKGKSSRFVPPTIQQVAEYCLERGNKVNPEHFIDHYTANGWKRGKTKMSDWKAAVRTWEKNNYNTASNATSTAATANKSIADQKRQEAVARELDFLTGQIEADRHPTRHDGDSDGSGHPDD
jgi:hypothetical protein